VDRYPELVHKDRPMLVGGWEVWCDWTGLPFHWRALTPAEVRGMKPNEVRIIEVDEAEERRQRSKQLVVRRAGGWAPGRDLQTLLQQLFGLR
jgi:hypothetical protein